MIVLSLTQAAVRIGIVGDLCAGYPGSAFPREFWESHMWAADIVYFPLRTKFLTDSKRADCRAMAGSGMAVNQAVHSFSLITGHLPDQARFEETFHRLTGQP